MKRTTLVLALVLAVGFSVGSCGSSSGGLPPAKVLLIYAVPDPAYATDVTDKLTALALFASVDSFNGGTGTPILVDLQAYDAVVVMNDSSFADEVALGDVLADYVDSGGGVVLSMFMMAAAPPTTISGRFVADDYFAMVPTGLLTGSGPVGMTPVIPGHPILNGVTTFSGGTSSFRPAVGSLSVGATLIAAWSDDPGRPLIATRILAAGQRRADVGFYPVTSDASGTFVDASTDAMRILANALLWVSNRL